MSPVILDTDAWALAFATCVTLVSVALAGLSAAQVTRWSRQAASSLLSSTQVHLHAQNEIQ